MKTDILHILSPLLMDEALNEQLEILPLYDEAVKNAPAPERLIALQDLYRVFVPGKMSREIYSKLYLALSRSLMKKQSLLAVRQSNENGKIIHRQSYESIIGGADSFTIIGQSGIGKSSSVSRAVQLLTNEPVIEMEDVKILPCLTVQAPADASLKGLMFEILRKTDEHLATNYYQNAVKARATLDVLIGMVSQVSLNHIGLLIIDEIQNVVNSKNGKAIIGTLTQFINNSGISVCMVGTPESTLFFDQQLMLARRSLGLQYERMDYSDEFRHFCEVLLRYCYVKESPILDESLFMWLYTHSAGNVSVVVSLLHDAQEIAILNGYEKLDISSLALAYNERLTMLHDYISPEPIKASVPKAPTVSVVAKAVTEDNVPAVTIAEIAASSKKAEKDAVTELQHHGFCIWEVAI